jgi:hypothetical protein
MTRMNTEMADGAMRWTGVLHLGQCCFCCLQQEQTLA